MHNSVNINRNLTVDKLFFEFLISSDNIINRIILNGETLPEINFIAPTGDSDLISFIPKNKIKPFMENPFGSGQGRATMKIGRLISKIIPDYYIKSYNINSSLIEEFVNKYKSFFDNSNVEFRIVEGEDIRRWYLDENYLSINHGSGGTLWNSCMRYRERQKFLDLYCQNTEIVKMLVLISKVDGVEKVRARALLWNNVENLDKNDLPKNIKIMDRIYYIFDSDVQKLKKWADDNGYIPKLEQNSKSHQYFDIKGQATKIRCLVSLEKSILKSYPYLDTFPFFNMDKGHFYNDEYNSSWEYKLVQANGSLTPPNESEDEEFTEDFDFVDDDF